MIITSDEHQMIQEDGALPLSDLVAVRPRFLRSVNLEKDFYSPDALAGYVPTPSALTALARIAAGVQSLTQRAWSVTGPYGTGKSALVLLLTKMLAPPPVGDPTWRQSITVPLFEADTDGFWPVLVTGGRAPLGKSLLRGLQNAMDRLPTEEASQPADMPGLFPEWELQSVSSEATGREVALAYEAGAQAVRDRVPHCQGLLVVIDELGKFLEYAALHPEEGDVQALQELAESAVRSTSAPLMIVTVLHQAFDQYAHRLPGTQQAEWRKVQGRFGDIAFGDAPEDAVRLVASAIASEPLPPAAAERLADTFTHWSKTSRELHLRPPTLSGGEWDAALRDSYPLHPLTLLTLPHVFRRFGQNERSLFGFLASAEPHGFADFLAHQALLPGSIPTLRVSDIYDYVVSALGIHLSGHAQAGRLWLVTQDALQRCEGKSPVWAALIKTIGLLHALGDAARLPASREILRFACDDFPPDEIDAALAQMQSATYITYRHFKAAYRPYEGSDIDIEARLREARAEIALAIDPVQTAQRLSPTLPLVARRHSYETGTLRFFEVRACRPADLEGDLSRPADADGLLLLCLAPDAVAFRAAENTARTRLTERPEVVVCLARETDALRDAAGQVESLLRVDAETPELLLDNVARREVDERLLEATAVLQAEWDALLRHQHGAETLWLWLGEPANDSDLQPLLSRACDAAYPSAPPIKNELINRRQLSSTAASARRELITAMLTRAPDARLGIEGWPPEASMYVSVLEETGLHRPISELPGETVWKFFPPPDPGSPLARVWAEIEEFLFSGELKPRPLIDLQSRLTRPPFGLADGVIPVLLCCVLLCHSDEVLVYEEERFVTQLDAATFERMIKRPEDYALQGCKVIGERQAVVERFARGLFKNGEAPTLVNVVRTLFRLFARLPEYTVKTRQLPADARALRDLFKQARGPEQLLFVDLPNLLECRPFAPEEADLENVAAFFTRWNTALGTLTTAYDALLERIEAALAAAFGTSDWAELRVRSAQIGAHLSEPKLTAFVQRASDETLERSKWLESIAAVVTGRPPFAWTDAEEKRFAPLLHPLAAAFAHSELLAFEKERQAGTIEPGEGIGFRLAITHDTGEEDASLVILSKAENVKVDELVEQMFGHFNATMEKHSHETRLAVIGQVMQKIMREKHHA